MTMDRNLSNTDIAARLVTAVIIATLYFSGTFPESLGIVLMLVAGLLALTAYLMWCPLYQFIGYRTYQPKNPETDASSSTSP